MKVAAFSQYLKFISTGFAQQQKYIDVLKKVAMERTAINTARLKELQSAKSKLEELALDLNQSECKEDEKKENKEEEIDTLKHKISQLNEEAQKFKKDRVFLVKLKSLDRVVKEQSKDYFKGKLSQKGETLHQTVLSLAYNRILPEKSIIKKLGKNEKHLRLFLGRVNVASIKPQILANLQKVANEPVENAVELCDYVKLVSQEHQTLLLAKALKEKVIGLANEQNLDLKQEQEGNYFSEAKLANFKQKVNIEKKFKKEQIEDVLRRTRDAEILLNEQKKELERLRQEVSKEKQEFDEEIESSGQINGGGRMGPNYTHGKKLSQGMVLQKRDTIEDDDDQPPQLTDFD